MKNNWNMFRFSEKQVALIVSRSSEFAGIVAMVSHFLFTILKGVLTNPTLAAFSKFEFSSSDKIISFTSDDQTWSTSSRSIFTKISATFSPSVYFVYKTGRDFFPSQTM